METSQLDVTALLSELSRGNQDAAEKLVPLVYPELKRLTAAEKKVVPKTRVVEVPGQEAGVRVFVVHSDERERYERSLRELSSPLAVISGR